MQGEAGEKIKKDLTSCEVLDRYYGQTAMRNVPSFFTLLMLSVWSYGERYLLAVLPDEVSGGNGIFTHVDPLVVCGGRVDIHSCAGVVLQAVLRHGQGHPVLSLPTYNPPVQIFFSDLSERKPAATIPNAAANPPTNAPRATTSHE